MNRNKILAFILAAAVASTSLAACSKKAVTGGAGSSAVTSTDGTSSDAVSTDEDEVVSDITVSSTAEESGASSGTSNSTGKSTAASSLVKPTNAPAITQNPSDTQAKLPVINVTNKTVTICLDWAPTNSWVIAWENAFKKCYPGITVKYKVATPTVKASKLAVWKSSNSSPDAIYIKPEESWPSLINKDLVEPVDSMIHINDAFWGSVKSIMGNLKVNGKTYVIVTDTMLYGSVVYNKTVMKNAGLTDPETLFYADKWTWDVFADYAKNLTKINTADSTKSRYGIHFHYAEPFIQTTGKDLIAYTSNGWVSQLNDTDVKATIAYLKKLGPTGDNYSLTGETEMTAIRSKVVSGQVGMYVTAESPGLEFPEQFKNGTLSYVPIPRYTKSTTYYHGSTVNAFYIPKGAQNPLGGLAYACSVRALNILNLDVSDGNNVKEYTDAQTYLNKYANSKLSGVPLQFRRLSGTVEYYNIYGPTFLSGDSYSKIVAQWEPQILEALKKE